MPIKAILESYRCPEDSFSLEVGKGIAAEPGYFRCGSKTVYFGKYLAREGTSRGVSKEIGAAREPVMEGNHVVLPFDPDEVIDNLRLERYTGVRLGFSERILKAVYYQLRKFLNDPARVLIQRMRASGWARRPFPRWPVDTTVEDICEDVLARGLQASGAESIPFVWFWPSGCAGCILMTHDVETAHGLAYCDQLMKADLALGIPASFQIVPEDRYRVEPSFLDALRMNGFEVCVQDLNHDGRLFDDRKEFLRRVKQINEYGRRFGAKGYRTGTLYRNPEWYEDFDFSFDMSIPNTAPMDPQRGGCCTVRPYFIGKILEIPLTTVQDYTLFYILRQPSIDLWKRQVEEILARNGLASFIVHPDYIADSAKFAVYRQLLEYLKEIREQRNLWFALPSEIDAWWRARSRMVVVWDGGAWRVQGQGAERAVLAFATLVDGKVTYRLESGASSGDLKDPVQRDASRKSIRGSMSTRNLSEVRE